MNCTYCNMTDNRQCKEPAEFEIIDLADDRDVGTTYSCETHIGALLGHAEGWDGRVLGWCVASLNPIRG